MASLDVELSAFNAQLPELESQHHGKWAVFHGASRVGIFDDFEEAATEAVRRFGGGPYLIGQVGAGPVGLPICVVRRQHNA